MIGPKNRAEGRCPEHCLQINVHFVTSFSQTGGINMLATLPNIALNTVLLAHFIIGVLFLYAEYKFLSKIKASKE
jgi:hypothetical protein